MSNSFFRFKQFKVEQDKCAMKVCTDACLFGAWVAEKFSTEKWKFDNILDIGTGTGLLSLMLAQTKTVNNIDAIDINPEAINQAAENFALSPWHKHLKAIEANLVDFKTDKKYDFVICNPPFFEHDLKSAYEEVNMALHSTQLSLIELVAQISLLLKQEGYFAVLLPFHRTVYFENLAEKSGFSLVEKVLVKQSEKHAHFRSMLLFVRNQHKVREYEIEIKRNGSYSDEFIRLLQSFYLYL